MLKSHIKELKNGLNVIISVTYTILRASCAGHTILFLYLSPPSYTLHTTSKRSRVSWMSFEKTTFLKLKNYHTTTDLDIFLIYTCIPHIWLRRKRITKNCCVFFCFPIQHTHFIQHPTFVLFRRVLWRIFFSRFVF